MKLNHLNLTVTDVLATYAFMKKYFELQDPYPGATNKGMGFLFDDEGTVITMMKATPKNPASTPKTFISALSRNHPKR